MRTSLLALLMLGCTEGGADGVDTGLHAIELPGHNECLPEGEEMTPETCAAVVEHDGRLPTVPNRANNTEAIDDDPRLDDAEYNWMTAEVKRCTCVCCHSESNGGPGVHRWDIDFEPVWIDSMNDWSISVFTGLTEEYEQTLPTLDMDRLRAVLDVELEKRHPDQ